MLHVTNLKMNSLYSVHLTRCDVDFLHVDINLQSTLPTLHTNAMAMKLGRQGEETPNLRSTVLPQFHT